VTLQPLFRRFHDAIQLEDRKQNADLRDKRERIKKRLRENLRPHTFESFNQGSYAMGTGVRPLNGDYDIDVGIVFNKLYKQEVTPLQAKQLVYDAVKEHTARVDWKNPCITVYYQQSGKLKYHVDLVVFARDRHDANKLWLARSKQNAAPAQQEWQADDRKGFIAAVKDRSTGEDGYQFRRVIRYLKRWADLHFPHTGHAKPSGFALTVAAASWFRAHSRSGDYDDLAATLNLVETMRGRFSYNGRLSLRFSHEPRDDVFGRMNDQQMREFSQRLEALAGYLQEAQRTTLVAPLRDAFGDDFPAQ